ncbi:MAG: fibronectin type III-like domain-contianing protein, partial [Oscillospiraceae bacterium]|nr:fibronectin type III-like domain-contianing protein [Oscillospiraceae bacterium]
NINPSGKLPLTFPKREEDAPCYLNFPGEAREVYYGEGIYVGYRYYDKKDIEPLFPFGFGLSYTSFALSDIRLSDEQWDTTKGAPLKVLCKVTNTGKTDGKEVVQLYIRDEVSSLDKPLRELKAFRKVFVKAGETVEVEFELTPEKFASYDPKLRKWIAEPGWFTIYLGNSSRNLPLSARVRLIGTNPYAVDPSAPAGALLASPEAVKVLKKYIPEKMVDDFAGRINQFPAMSLEMFWRRGVARSLPGTTEEKNALRDKLYAELSKVNIVE